LGLRIKIPVIGSDSYVITRPAHNPN